MRAFQGEGSGDGGAADAVRGAYWEFLLLMGVESGRPVGEVLGPRNLVQAIGGGITTRGFLVGRYENVEDRFLVEMGGWLARGEASCRETAVKGVDDSRGASWTC